MHKTQAGKPLEFVPHPIRSVDIAYAKSTTPEGERTIIVATSHCSIASVYPERKSVMYLHDPLSDVQVAQLMDAAEHADDSEALHIFRAIPTHYEQAWR